MLLQDTGKTLDHDDRDAGSMFRVAGWVSRLASFGLVIAILLVVGGFLRFYSEVSALKNDTEITPADGIVVLTGGKARIETALQLLADGKGKRLLISGVHPRSTPAAIRKAVGGSSELFDCCVDFDRTARDTIGNATQTGKWARANGFVSIIVVTSDYHMPRSLMEMRRHLPDIRFIPYYVRYETADGHNSLSDPALLRLMAGEYLKYLATSLRYRFTGTDTHAALANARQI